MSITVVDVDVSERTFKHRVTAEFNGVKYDVTKATFSGTETSERSEMELVGTDDRVATLILSEVHD